MEASRWIYVSKLSRFGTDFLACVDNCPDFFLKTYRVRGYKCELKTSEPATVLVDSMPEFTAVGDIFNVRFIFLSRKPALNCIKECAEQIARGC